MCTCRPEIQTYPGQQQKQCDQQGEGGDHISPPHLCEIPAAVLRAALGPPAHKGHRVAVDAPLLEVFKAWLDEALGNLL